MCMLERPRVRTGSQTAISHNVSSGAYAPFGGTGTIAVEHPALSSDASFHEGAARDLGRTHPPNWGARVVSG
jgi:hypothetical protein